MCLWLPPQAVPIGYVIQQTSGAAGGATGVAGGVPMGLPPGDGASPAMGLQLDQSMDPRPDLRSGGGGATLPVVAAVLLRSAGAGQGQGQCGACCGLSWRRSAGVKVTTHSQQRQQQPQPQPHQPQMVQTWTPPKSMAMAMTMACFTLPRGRWQQQAGEAVAVATRGRQAPSSIPRQPCSDSSPTRASSSTRYSVPLAAL